MMIKCVLLEIRVAEEMKWRQQGRILQYLLRIRSDQFEELCYKLRGVGDTVSSRCLAVDNRCVRHSSSVL